VRGSSQRRASTSWTPTFSVLTHFADAFYDLERFGIRFVASPRYADILLVTGPVTKKPRETLERTYCRTPDPKWAVALGDCTNDGLHFLRGALPSLAGFETS
jgi:Ni,Fe-hydrogenase III small subunit